MVSEFYYLCTLRVKEWRPRLCDASRMYNASYMNAWLQRHLQETHETSALEYLMHNSHWTPHSDYVMAPHDIRMLDYVLRMDDPQQFHNDFARLMKAFGLSDLQLREMQSIGSHGQDSGAQGDGADDSKPVKLTTADLTQETIALIEDKYQKDLQYFGYASETLGAATV